MVKSLVSIAVAVSLLFAACIFEWFYVEDQFASFREEVQTLYEKIDNETANEEDARAVQSSWESRKDRLQVWIPHNDVVRMDDYMAETVRLIGEKDFRLALSKIEILLHDCECIPGTYRPGLENIF